MQPHLYPPVPVGVGSRVICSEVQVRVSVLTLLPVWLWGSPEALFSHPWNGNSGTWPHTSKRWCKAPIHNEPTRESVLATDIWGWTPRMIHASPRDTVLADQRGLPKMAGLRAGPYYTRLSLISSGLHPGCRCPAMFPGGHPEHPCGSNVVHVPVILSAPRPLPPCQLVFTSGLIKK